MKIAMLIYEHFTALDIIGPYEVLQGVPGAEIQFVAKRAGPVTVDSGAFALVAPYALSEVTEADVLVVPGSSSGTLTAAADREITAWIRKLHEGTRFTTSVCSGALLLGQAGLLAGQPATTHWAAMPFLGQFGATPRPHERIVRSGKVITAAGVSAGIDMALYLLGELAGRQRAESVQLMVEYDPQPAFSAGHTSKASCEVQALATREMLRLSLKPREVWAMLRLVGQRFVSRGKRPVAFEVPQGPAVEAGSSAIQEALRDASSSSKDLRSPPA